MGDGKGIMPVGGFDNERLLTVNAADGNTVRTKFDVPYAIGENRFDHRHLVCETTPDGDLLQSERTVRTDAVLRVVRSCSRQVTEINWIQFAVVDTDLIYGMVCLQVPDVAPAGYVLSV